MLASFGGLVINPDGSREWPGSGGYVGASNGPGRNYGTLAGAGENYHSFVVNNNLPGDDPRFPECFPNCRDDPGGGPDPGRTGGGGTGGQTGGTGGNGTGSTGGTGGTGGGTTGGTGGGTKDPVPCNDCEPWIFPDPNTGVWDTLRQLLTPSARTNVNANPPLNIFTPAQNSGDGGLNVKTIVILAVLGLGVWFVYKRMM